MQKMTAMIGVYLTVTETFCCLMAVKAETSPPQIDLSKSSEF